MTADEIRGRGFRLFVAGVAGHGAAVLTLAVGLVRMGLGYGDPAAFWYAGLAVWFLACLVVLVGCVGGAVAWGRTGRPALWTVPGAVVLAADGVIAALVLRG